MGTWRILREKDGKRRLIYPQPETAIPTEGSESGDRSQLKIILKACSDCVQLFFEINIQHRVFLACGVASERYLGQDPAHFVPSLRKIKIKKHCSLCQSRSVSVNLPLAEESMLKNRMRKNMDNFYQAVFMLFLLFLYILSGAVVFQLLERPNELQLIEYHSNEIEDARRNLIEAWKGNVSIDVASNHLSILETSIIDAIEDGCNVYRDGCKAKWDIFPAIFFAATSLMTIGRLVFGLPVGRKLIADVETSVGYGDVYPTTLSGRVFCIIFSITGVPFLFLVIGEWGSLTSRVVRLLSNRLKLRTTFTKRKKMRKIIWMVISASFVLTYMLIGSILMLLWEDWNFFDAFYFCFITVTTIGLGDIVPGNEKYLIFCAIYVLIGMALFSAIFNKIQNDFSEGWHTVHKLTTKLQEMVQPLTSATLHISYKLKPDSQERSTVLGLLTELQAFKEQLNLISKEAKGSPEYLAESHQNLLAKQMTLSTSTVWHMEWDPSWEKRWQIFREFQSIKGREN
ncbi:potassium channel subfamily K member 5-like [Artemia franciscana]